MARKYMYLLLKTTSEGDGNKAYIIMNLWITKLKIARNIPSHITHYITGFARTFCRQLLYCNQYYVHVIWNSHQDCAWVILMDFCYCCCCCFWVIFMVKLLLWKIYRYKNMFNAKSYIILKNLKKINKLLENKLLPVL